MDFLSHFVDQSSIFFPPYLASAFFLTMFWLVFTQNLTFRGAIKNIFEKRAFFNKSCLVDLTFTLINLGPWRVVVAAVEAATFSFGLVLTESILGKFDLGFEFIAPVAVEAGLATIVTMVAIDFASYVTHRLMHYWGPLWEIHSVHHSAEVLNPLTTYRQHLLEPIVLNASRSTAAGIGLSVFHSVFPQNTPVVTISGLGAGFFIYMFTVNLHHSSIPVRYPNWLCLLFVSPHVHHIHHSVETKHHDANFGVVFSIWDRIFGTYIEEDLKLSQLRFGLGDADKYRHSIIKCFFLPFLTIAGGKYLPAAAFTRLFLFAFCMLFLFPCS